MRIGQFVKSYIKDIFLYCDTVDPEETTRLMDADYSKQTFDVNFPFCAEVSSIPPELSRRYWTDQYQVGGKTVRVTSQWFDSHVSKSRALFADYLITKAIVSEDELSPDALNGPNQAVMNHVRRSSRSNSRYKGNAIGNAQNLVIRNILSNLGEESFNENDWQETKAFFGNQCAYCSAEDSIIMDHIIPINKNALGEHRLGNLVPSCKRCNSRKADRDYRKFLADAPHRIQKIEEYMDKCRYVPLGENDRVQKILEMAYEDAGKIAERYIAILNELLPQ